MSKILMIVFCVIVSAVLYFQPSAPGFEKGHHGWVSSHTLAQVVKTTPDSYLVGYALAHRRDDGKLSYYYFDRYSPIFAIVFNSAFHVLDTDVVQTILLARQMMNLIFLLTMGGVYILLRRLACDALRATIATVMGFSGYYFMFYKDMVHYDQPAVLGMVLLLIAITYYRQEKKAVPLYLTALCAISIGRGIASFAILVLWGILEILDLSILKKLKWHEALHRVRHIIGVALVVIILSAWQLGYNIWVEARMNGISIQETSIFVSAKTRTGLDAEFNAQYQEERQWVHFTTGQIRRVIRSVFPYVFNVHAVWPASNAATYLVAILMLLLVGITLSHVRREQQILVMVLAFSGFVWCFFMKNLTIFHDYTAMYYFGFTVCVYWGVLNLIPNRILPLILFIAVCFFVLSLELVGKVHYENLEKDHRNQISEDFKAIEAILSSANNVYIEGGYRNLLDGAPYSLGFYLKDHWLAPAALAKYRISKDQSNRGNSLTPNNVVVFLYQN